MKHYRVIILLACAIVAMASALCSAAPATITIYHGTNWIAAPLVPYNPDPVAVFGDFATNGDLKRWDAVTQTFVTYSSSTALDFAGILLGDGYVVQNDGDTRSVTYDGVPDGNPDSHGNMTDMWISVPFAGLTFIGHPFYHPTLFDLVLVTDGTTLKTWQQAVDADWVDPYLRGWDGATQTEFTLGLPTAGADECVLMPCHGYWVTSRQANLAMIVPWTPVPEPSCLAAVIVGLAGIVRLRRRQRD